MRKALSAATLSAAIGAAVLVAPAAHAASPYVVFSGKNQRLTATAKNIPAGTTCTFYRNLTQPNSSAAGSSGSTGGHLVAIGRKAVYKGEATIMSRMQRPGTYPVRMRCLGPVGAAGVQNVVTQRDGAIRITAAKPPTTPTTPAKPQNQQGQQGR